MNFGIISYTVDQEQDGAMMTPATLFPQRDQCQQMCTPAHIHSS